MPSTAFNPSSASGDVVFKYKRSANEHDLNQLLSKNHDLSDWLHMTGYFNTGFRNQKLGEWRKPTNKMATSAVPKKAKQQPKPKPKPKPKAYSKPYSKPAEERNKERNKKRRDQVQQSREKGGERPTPLTDSFTESDSESLRKAAIFAQFGLIYPVSSDEQPENGS